MDGDATVGLAVGIATANDATDTGGMDAAVAALIPVGTEVGEAVATGTVVAVAVGATVLIPMDDV